MAWWKFWKKEEDDLAAFERELGLARDTGLETEKPSEESYNKLGTEEKFGEEKYGSGIGERERYEQPKQIQQFSQTTDIQLVSAKLDTVKAMLDVVTQKIDNLEKELHEKQKQKLW